MHPSDRNQRKERMSDLARALGCARQFPCPRSYPQTSAQSADTGLHNDKNSNQTDTWQQTTVLGPEPDSSESSAPDCSNDDTASPKSSPAVSLVTVVPIEPRRAEPCHSNGVSLPARRISQFDGNWEREQGIVA